VGACAGAGETLDAIFVAVLLFGINSGLRPLSRLIDRHSLSKLDLNVLYRLRILCETTHKAEGELYLRRAIDEHSLVLRELKMEDNEETETSVLQALVESHAPSNEMLQQIAEELRVWSWVESAEVATATDPEAE
jgi:uncharacterized membrane protein YhiD involved in acid resistance